MAFEVPPLPYDYTALEPYIDKETMHLHHDKHHQAYVTNLNAALEKAPELQKMSAEELLKGLENVPEAIRNAVRNNGGGHVNHSMFWKIMAPNAGGNPSGAIADAIKNTFGDFNAFKEKFNDAGLKQFGSGWTWLVRDRGGKLQVVSSANQDNPMSQGFYPIMGNDVLGARLLPEISEPPRRLPERMVERGELGGSEQALSGEPEVSSQMLRVSSRGALQAHPFLIPERPPQLAILSVPFSRGLMAGRSHSGLWPRRRRCHSCCKRRQCRWSRRSCHYSLAPVLPTAQRHRSG